MRWRLFCVSRPSALPYKASSRQGTCWQAYVKGVTIMVNSSYNGYRYEDVWLNK
jgi:peptide/nickel transport system substrate-binding protein